MNILEKMKLRRRVLEAKKENIMIANFRRKYRETHNEKYLSFLSGITGEADYTPPDLQPSIRNYN